MFATMLQTKHMEVYMKTGRIIKSILALTAAVVLCCGCAGGYTSDEPCVWCHQSPTKEFKTSNGTACYVCEHHAKTCAVCNKTFEKELRHSTNLLDIELFMCDDCYSKYNKG